MHISEALQRAYRQMPVFKKDERIFPLLESFPKQYLGKDYAGATNRKGRHVNINDLDSVRLKHVLANPSGIRRSIFLSLD